MSREKQVIKKRSTHTIDLVVILFLLLAGWKFTYGMEGSQDVNFHDPSFYLLNGVTLTENGLPEAEDAPLYSIWYHLLSLTESDRVELYFRNYKALTALLPIAVYVVIRGAGVSWLASMIAAAFSLISYLNFPSFTRVYHFAAVIVLLSLFFSCRVKRVTVSLVIAALGALLASYARPELFLAFLSFVLIYAGVLITRLRRKQIAGEGPPLVVLLVVSIVLLVWWGVPIKGGRSFVAFSEHFAMNWVAWTGSDIDSWTHAREIVSDNFGDCQSAPGALLSNPAIFFRHIASNLRALPSSLLYVFSLHAKPIVTGHVVVAVLGLYLLVTWREWRRRFRACLQEQGRQLLLCAVYLGASLVSVLLIYPRYHYLVLPAVLIVISIVPFVAGRESSQHYGDYRKAAVAGIVLFALMPGLPSAPPQRNLTVIRFIRGLGITDEVTLLHEGGVPHIYLGDNYNSTYAGWKQVPFREFRAEQGINMILLSDRLSAYSQLKSDDEWGEFLRDCHEEGWVRMLIPGTKKQLVMDFDLLPEPNDS